MKFAAVFIITIILTAYGQPAHAYIGPGAGFALVSSFFILILAFFLALFTILTLPLRATYLFFKRRNTLKNSRAKRVIVLGFDGLDPDLCTQFIKEGKLPNLKKLSTEGSFRPLKTTTPAISPVAWSTFATGVNPGKHRIFDFFTRNPNNYAPVLSSALISTRKVIKALGPFKFAKLKTSVKLLRKSTAFWQTLGNKKIFSTVLRVPITFPPEKFYGTCLSAMCAPDLRGTQGSFTLFSSENSNNQSGSKGTIGSISLNGNSFKGAISGPAIKPGKDNELTIPISGKIDHPNDTVTIKIEDQQFILKKGIYSPWITLTFKSGFRQKITGIARLLVKELKPHLKIYMTPINIAPENPNLPISHPFYYSIYLAKMHGPFSTLGLAEDTWALNEAVIDEGDFLTQTYDIYEERKKAFLYELKKGKEGMIVSVFDTTDRIQHMFFRYLDKDHPANAGKDTTDHINAITDVYEKSDQLVGEVLAELKKDDLLMVISDHGFKQFKWGINLNTWLWQEGYLVLKENTVPGKEWFIDVDWSKTRAYGFGLAGIFINTKGREKNGIVAPGKEKKLLAAEIGQKLANICGPEDQIKPINRIIYAGQELNGPYVGEAPDLFVGYQEGYRVSWNSAVGRITESIIEPNTKRWSGDHCLDPELVPGVIFSNWHLEEETPALIDIAPTILDIFGLKKQKFHDGKTLNFSPGPKQ